MKINYLSDANLSESDLHKMGGKAQSLARLAHQFPVPPGFVLFQEANELDEAIQKIGGFPVAVRSSGSLEDMANASFAGLYETFLFIQNPIELKDAIKKCFDSRHSHRVKDYLETKKIEWNPESLSMSVLVQKMVDAKIAGVLFTLNPTNGREEEIYLEFCEGVGERLVSGHVTPSRVTYNWQTDEVLNVAINDEKTTIDKKHLKELIDLSLRIQAFYGRPQDIEWAVGKDDKVYILQSRPVTTLNPREDKPELTNADLKDGGISARVCSPLMFSAYREALKISMGDYFKRISLIPNDEKVQWLHYHYGRVYWNAEAVKEGLKKLPDFNEEDFDRDLGIQKDYGESGPHKTSTTVASVVAAIPVLIGLNREFRDCENMIAQFRVRFETQDEELKHDLPQLKKMNTAVFNKWFLDVILFQNETEKNYFRTIYNNSNFQTEFKSYLKKLPEYQEGDEIDLMTELHGVSHLDVQGGLGKLSKIADFYGYDSRSYYAARQEFLKYHYHHGPAELDLMVPRWGENKEWVDELVKSYVFVPTHGESKFRATFDRIADQMNLIRRRKFYGMTERSREFLRVREEMRSYSTRAYYLLRQGLLEFAKRNGVSEFDIFMWDLVEVKRFLLGLAGAPDIRLRTLYYQGYRAFTPPNEFGGSIKAMKSSANGLKGLGCSPGEIVGRARVIMDIHKTNELTKEDILITAFTDPGWTPVLARVGGVVTEVGGLLSHAAVIGREYGIPAILNLIDATKLIQDGDLIKINGKTGIVEVLEKGAKS
ncbi:PEP/pyruvate-binding domain-containing protein [Peredibacter starrii]|uniref:PEP/pyruvate-binding domain-containing protein n=1 Tax=Peredibacter starrii TaxID=28202 RepID=A0AAX4HPA1_9BACT|nr:PEP/pyruvate-binding domain-containing protein [Peredibacter starrii]WPU64995.1 PEP/pyruvate-binding domain-containing protein [Peredibacter starrii]